jgi:hypothetical protein
MRDPLYCVTGDHLINHIGSASQAVFLCTFSHDPVYCAWREGFREPRTLVIEAPRIRSMRWSQVRIFASQRRTLCQVIGALSMWSRGR